jgi:hypothetical protein
MISRENQVFTQPPAPKETGKTNDLASCTVKQSPKRLSAGLLGESEACVELNALLSLA